MFSTSLQRFLDEDEDPRSYGPPTSATHDDVRKQRRKNLERLNNCRRALVESSDVSAATGEKLYANREKMNKIMEKTGDVNSDLDRGGGILRKMEPNFLDKFGGGSTRATTPGKKGSERSTPSSGKPRRGGPKQALLAVGFERAPGSGGVVVLAEVARRPLYRGLLEKRGRHFWNGWNGKYAGLFVVEAGDFGLRGTSKCWNKKCSSRSSGGFS